MWHAGYARSRAFRPEVSAIVALGSAAVANPIRSIRRWPVIRKHAAANRLLSQGRRGGGQDARPAARHEHQRPRGPLVAGRSARGRSRRARPRQPALLQRRVRGGALRSGSGGLDSLVDGPVDPSRVPRVESRERLLTLVRGYRVSPFADRPPEIDEL